MIINDKRNKQFGVTYDKMEQGQVYIINEHYILCTDEDQVVSLADGFLWQYQDFSEDDIFTPVNAKLEIS